VIAKAWASIAVF